MSLRSVPRPAVLTVAAAVALVLTAPAHAAQLCVANPACAGTNYDTVNGALHAAQATAAPDTVAIAAGTYVGNFTYFADSVGNTVHVTGAGVGATVLRANTGSNAVLRIDPEDTTGPNVVEHLTIQLPTGVTAENASGLWGENLLVRDVAVEVPASDRGTARTRTGVQLRPGVLEHCTVTMSTADPTGTSHEDIGVRARLGQVRVSDSAITANTGVNAYENTGSPGVIVERSIVRSAGTALDVHRTNARVDSTVAAAVDASTGFQGVVMDVEGAGRTLTARNLTVVGGQSHGTGLIAYGDDATGRIEAFNSIVRGVATSLYVAATNGGLARIATSSSAISPAPAVDPLPGDTALLHTDPIGTVDPGWVDPAGGDFRLRFGSPLIDRGAPGALAAEASLTDVLGAARLVDGNGDGTARVDVGATEYQRLAPVPVATAAPASVLVGEQVTFDASGSSEAEPAEEIAAYAWAFDDGAGATDMTAQHAFDTPGRHVATLRVTDEAGAAAETTVAVEVRPLPVTAVAPSGIGPAAQVRPLLLTGLRFTPARVRRGRAATVRLTLSRPATVTLRVERLQTGRRVGRRCVVGRRRGRRCTRTTTLRGSITRRLPAGPSALRFTASLGGRRLAPGRYRLVARAVAGSERTPAARVSFRVTR